MQNHTDGQGRMVAKADLLLCSGVRQIRQRESERVGRWEERKGRGVRKRRSRRRKKEAARVPYCWCQSPRGLSRCHDRHNHFFCNCCQMTRKKRGKKFLLLLLALLFSYILTFVNWWMETRDNSFFGTARCPIMHFTLACSSSLDLKIQTSKCVQAKHLGIGVPCSMSPPGSFSCQYGLQGKTFRWFPSSKIVFLTSKYQSIFLTLSAIVAFFVWNPICTRATTFE